jgi:hypothetical protein
MPQRRIDDACEDMRMTIRKICLALGFTLLAAGLARAQAETGCSEFRVHRDAEEPAGAAACLDGPVSGFTFDEKSGQVYPILGIAGALRLEAPLNLGMKLEAVRISGRQNYAVAVSAGDRNVVFLGFRDRAVYLRESGLPAGPGRFSISTNGRFAALHYPALGQIVAVSMAEPEITWVADASPVAAEIVSLSVSDDGARVLAGTAAGGVYSFSKDGGAPLVASMTSPVIIRYLRDSHDAVIVDGAEKNLYYYSETAGGAWSFASADDGISTPIDLAIAEKNDRLYLVNADSENIAMIEFGSGRTEFIACNCIPRSLARFSGSALYGLTNVADASLLLFQPAESGGEILFVPKANAGPAPEQSPEPAQADRPAEASGDPA